MARSHKDGLEVITIAFTSRCNLACDHCVHDFLNRDSRQELPVSFFIQALKEARDIGARTVNITGGEIFIRPDCLELVSAAVAMGYSVTLDSNGTLITEANIRTLGSFRNKIRIAVSLDGITREVHEATRGPKTFEKTIATLKRLKTAGVPTRVNTVLLRRNLSEVPAIARFAVDELGIGWRLLPLIMSYGKGVCACKSDGVPYEEVEKLTKGFFYPFLRERHFPRSVSISLNVALVPVDVGGHNLCSLGKSLIGIGPSGVISSCHVGNNNREFIFGSLQEDSLSNIWRDNERLKSFRNLNPDTLKGVCGNCLARAACRGGCRVHAISSYQDFLAPDPQCQAVYNLGKFPEHALENETRDCHYNPKVG
ncbi:MAG: radical SAM protein [bacterium]